MWFIIRFVVGALAGSASPSATVVEEHRNGRRVNAQKVATRISQDRDPEALTPSCRTME